ncbi:MAG: hypothetical protein HY862_01080 [Chloroflexi bacterium]|nr:hypothetical protein [Chloroflexota bacterium]
MNDQEHLADIHTRALVEKITPDELEWVASELQKYPCDLSCVQMLMILARQEAKQYRSLVERFLEYQGEWFCVAEALGTLCRWWKDTHLYVDYLLRYMGPIEAENYSLVDVSHVRMVAIHLAGEYLRFHKEPRLLSRLIELYENPDLPELSFIKDPNERAWEIQFERGSVRGDAYFALADAMGQDYRTLPRIEDEADLAKKADPQVIIRAKERLETQL